MKQSTFTLVIATLLACCSKKDITPECGCDSKLYQELIEVKAAYSGHGTFLYIDPQNSNHIVPVKLCDATLVDPTWQPSTTYSFILSGQKKSPCYIPGVDNITTVYPLVPTRIVKE